MVKKHPAPESGVNLGIIITPMLDMSFQILAFFIMTYHPPSMEGHIAGSLMPDIGEKKKEEKKKSSQGFGLGETKPKETKKKEELPKEDVPPEFYDILLVHIKTGSKNITPKGEVWETIRVEKVPRLRFRGEPTKPSEIKTWYANYPWLHYEGQTLEIKLDGLPSLVSLELIEEAGRRETMADSMNIQSELAKLAGKAEWPDNPDTLFNQAFHNSLQKLKTELENIAKKTAALQESGKDKTKIRIKAEGDLKHQYAMVVFDVCKQAGFQRVYFVDPKGE